VVHNGFSSMQQVPIDVLVVDDDKSVAAALRLCFETAGCRVETVHSAASARAAADQRAFDLVLLDQRLGQESGLDVIPMLRARKPAPTVVVLTAFAGIDSAVEAMRRGARDYMTKPLAPEQVRALVQRTADERRVTPPQGDDRRSAQRRPEIDLHSESPAMKRVLELAARAAVIDGPLLIRGESSTGKSVLARQVHALSERASQPFVTMRCAALHPGEPWPAAESGTLYLDEVCDLDPALQLVLSKRLDAVQPRIMAATRHDLDKEVRCGRFRRDLHARLRILELVVPPLRERPEDILPLARRFLAFFAQGRPVTSPELSLEAERALMRYRWPGNLGELIDAMERAVLLRHGLRIDADALPEPIALVESAHQLPRVGGDFTVEEIEREHILRVLARARSQEEASRILGIDGSTLWRKRRRYERGG
jgi:NtrC-family two-component system response regulator AlgB